MEADKTEYYRKAIQECRGRLQSKEVQALFGEAFAQEKDRRDRLARRQKLETGRLPTIFSIDLLDVEERKLPGVVFLLEQADAMAQSGRLDDVITHNVVFARSPEDCPCSGCEKRRAGWWYRFVHFFTDEDKHGSYAREA